MRNILYKLFNRIYEILYSSHVGMSNHTLRRHFFLGGGNCVIGWPYVLQGVENFQFSDNVSIGPGATIYSTAAKLIIKEHVVTGPNLTIITGDHMPIVGRYIDTVKASGKKPECDQDVIIESNVWIGCNVTILKGVTMGRGSIVAAGSVLTKTVPPYSIVGGVPARIIKKVFTDNEIRIHEQMLSNQVKWQK